MIKNNSCHAIKCILSILQNFIEETVIILSPKGIGIQDYDASKSVHIEIKIAKSEFNTYSVSEEKRMSVFLNELYAIFNKSQDAEAFELDLLENQVKIIIEGNTRRTYELPLLEKQHSTTNAPQYDFAANFKLPILVFEEIINNGLILSQELEISAENGSLKFNVQETNKKGMFELSKIISDKISLTTKDKNKLSSKYALEILSNMVKSLHQLGADECTVYFGNHFPLKLECTKGNIKVSFCLGPRV